MNSTNDQNLEDELLLYWSGELEPARAAAVERRLGSDPQARAYVDELEELSLHTPPLANPPRSDRSMAAAAVAQFAAENRDAGQRKIFAFPPAVRWVAVAAAIAVAAFVIWPRPGTSPEQLPVAESAPPADEQSPKEVKLSKFLFSTRGEAEPTASTLGERIASSRKRTRQARQGLQSAPPKISTRKS